MKKKCLIILITAVLLAQLSACASPFYKEYLSVNKLEDTAHEVVSEGVTSVKNYMELKLAVTRLVTAHEEVGNINFSSYNGDINKDIAAACKDVGTKTLLGAYSVDYISYDLDRIVAYYEASIYVTYKKTADEIEEIKTVGTEAAVLQSLLKSLKAHEKHVVILAASSELDERGMLSYIREAYLTDPTTYLKLPTADVTIYSGEGLSKIYELSIDYGGDAAELQNMRAVLSDEVELIVDGIDNEAEEYLALGAADYLVTNCAFSEDARNTAWSALIESSADSEGFALAYKELCTAAGIECAVVEGKLNKVPQFWNIIKLGDSHYHVDVSRIAREGYAEMFLVNDHRMRREYWWDYGNYPTCDGVLTYAGLAHEPVS